MNHSPVKNNTRTTLRRDVAINHRWFKGTAAIVRAIYDEHAAIGANVANIPHNFTTRNLYNACHPAFGADVSCYRRIAFNGVVRANWLEPGRGVP